MPRWDKALYTNEPIIDVPGLGRYIVRCTAQGSRTWRAWLNNKPTSYYGTKQDVMAAVDRAIRQREQSK